MIKDELPLAVKDLPRNEVLSKSIKNVLLIKTRSIKEQIKLINDCAPEHLILLDNNFSSFIPEISNAGSIFCGPLTPVSFGDYASGTNHVLPTFGSAKFSSGLGVKDFITQTSYNELSKKGVDKLGKNGILLSEIESLIGHTRSIKKRMEKK